MSAIKKRTVPILTFTLTIFLATAFAPPWAPPPINPYPETGSNNDKHEIMVYSLTQYDQYYASNLAEHRDWKENVYLDIEKDPFYGFWNEMDCTDPECMYFRSYRRRNQDVTVDNMVGPNGWHEADMVFFFGHNAQISPPYQAGMHSLWKPRRAIDPLTHAKYTVWDLHEEEFCVDAWSLWGTCEDPSDPENCQPYLYHKYPITDASRDKGYAVFYAYNPFTSVLIGKDFTEGGWLTENTWDQRPGDGHIGQLGDDDTEWIIGHGCSAVIVAEYIHAEWPKIVPTPLGVSAWSKSWSDLHMVLGHYYLISPSQEPNLEIFAYHLKYGTPIRLAYFGVHNDYCSVNDPAIAMPSAIAKSPVSCCYSHPDGVYCPPGGCEGDYMNSETWTDPMPDPIHGDYYYTTSYMTCEASGPVIHSTEGSETSDQGGLQYEVTGDAAQALLQGNTIPRRGLAYDFTQDGESIQLPRIQFSVPTTQKLHERLYKAAEILEVNVTSTAIVEDDRTLRLDLDGDVAFIVKDSGTLFVLRPTDASRGKTFIQDDNHAVNLALDQVAESGLLDLADGETLDVIGVTATHYAGWMEGQDGELIPVIYKTDSGEEVTDYISEYTVTFGRRYKGVPIIGPNLKVILDGSGKMIAYMQEWRTILGESPELMDLLPPDEIDENRTTSVGPNLEVKLVACGYTEDSGAGVHQDFAGVGCRYLFQDKNSAQPMQYEEWVNAARDPSFEMWGSPIPRKYSKPTPNYIDRPNDD